MIVVCDASPLYGLLVLEKIYLLRELFQKVIVPQQVWSELSNLANNFIDSQTFSTLTAGIEIAFPVNHPLIATLLVDLDAGEAEAIALALEIDADWLLIDEREGRRIAASHGLKVKGLIGLLLDAKDAGYIDAIKPLLHDLQQKISFRISPAILQQVLKDANE